MLGNCLEVIFEHFIFILSYSLFRPKIINTKESAIISSELESGFCFHNGG